MIFGLLLIASLALHDVSFDERAEEYLVLRQEEPVSSASKL